jgi:hypothetical protein
VVTLDFSHRLRRFALRDFLPLPGVLLSGAVLACDPLVVDAVRARECDPAAGECVDAGAPPAPPFYASLAHRYRFDGFGEVVTDSVGGADGVVVGSSLAQVNDGVVLSGGAAAEYVELPAGIISVLRSATFESWLTWAGGGPGSASSTSATVPC